MIEVSVTSLLYYKLLLNMTKTLTNVSCGDIYINITIAKHHSAINGFFLYKNLC